MSLDNKPHSAEPIAVEDVNQEGKKILRFTDAWFNYFNSVDQNINITITQNILNQTLADSPGYTPDVEIEVEQLKATVNSLFSTVRDLTDAFNQIGAEIVTRYETETLNSISEVRYTVEESTSSGEYSRPGHIHSISDIEGYSDSLPSYAVAAVPTASANVRRMIYVSDESGGAVPAFSDGTNWRRVTDRAIIS
jgi:hypothetical protein